MKKQSVWESGASTFKVHDLILFSDNTSILADAKFEIIKRFKKAVKQDIKKGSVLIDLKKFNQIKLAKELFPFCEQAVIMYKQSVGPIKLTQEEMDEFCRLASEEVL